MSIVSKTTIILKSPRTRLHLAFRVISGSDVAVRPSQGSDEMILGRVIAYYADIGVYDVADVDNSKKCVSHV